MLNKNNRTRQQEMYLFIFIDKMSWSIIAIWLQFLIRKMIYLITLFS